MKKILFLLFCTPLMAQAQAPANDDPCGAITLPISAAYGFCTATDFTMAGSTHNPSFTNPGCSGGTKSDLWYKFTMPASGNVKIYMSSQAVSPNSDATLQIFTSTDCNTTITYLDCNDDGGSAPNDLMPYLLHNNTPGVVIFVRIYQFNGAVNGLYNICVSTPPPLDNITKVGIGIANPDSTLDVNGNMVVRGALRVAGNLKLNAGTPGAGKVLTSDASGTATWQTPAAGVGTGSTSQTLRNNGTGWVASSVLQNDGTIVTVANQIKIAGGVPGAGKVLTSDASGLASWADPAAGAVAFALRLDSNRTLVSGASPIRLHFGNYGNGYGNFNTGAFSEANDEFVAPSPGFYSFNIDSWPDALASFDYEFRTEFITTNAGGNLLAQHLFVDKITAGNTEATYSHSIILNLGTGDRVFIMCARFGGTGNTAVNYGFGSIKNTQISGFKIR